MSYFLSSSSSSDQSSATLSSLDWVRDVPCEVEFVLGDARLRLRDCLELGPRSIIRLEQAAGADVELRAEGRVIASGEIVIVDNTAGLRITRILPPPEPDAEVSSHE
jgi:flagellar motor switch protein FliN/FliY